MQAVWYNSGPIESIARAGPDQNLSPPHHRLGDENSTVPQRRERDEASGDLGRHDALTASWDRFAPVGGEPELHRLLFVERARLRIMNEG